MAKVTALGMDVITERSGHVVSPIVPSICTTPAAPSPVPVPYPVSGTSREGIAGAPIRTKIGGVPLATVGSAFEACHGNEPGTLEDVVSMSTGGPVSVMCGAPVVICELGMTGITGSPVLANKGPGPTTRSAPAPMVGPMPGVAAGIAVLGSGAGSGGADGDAEGGDDSANGGGKGDGKHAPGGQPGQCANGHPVDVVTGRAYTLPAIDLELPGPLPLVFARTYSSSAAHRDVGLGFGWGHAFGWEIEARRRAIVVWSDEGIAVEFPVLAVGAEVVGPWGWILRRARERFVLDTGDGVLRVFVALDDEAACWKLIEVRDDNDNRIELTYDDQAQLCELRDSAGRLVCVTTGRSGRIEAIHVSNARARGRWIAVASYAYDAAGNLVKATDAEGYACRYAYDDEHRLTRETDRTGLSFHFVYDRAGRCVETWGAYDGKSDPSLAAGLSPMLADGVRAKGIHHCRFDYHAESYTEVADSMEIRAYFGNAHGLVDKQVIGGDVEETAYDARGLVVASEDGEGAVTTHERDAHGRVLRVIDPLARVTAHERDVRGRVVRVVDPAGGVTTIQRDARGNVLHEADPTGAVLSYEYDERGLVTSITSPCGGVTRFAYEAEGNLIERTDPNGARSRWAYDALGHRVLAIDPLGNETRWTWTPRGDVAASFDATGGIVRYTYDGERRCCEIQGPGRRSAGLTWGGFHRLVARTDGNGNTARFRYDREGELAELENENGEVHRIVRDTGGRIVREETFDGRIAYWHDHARRVVRVEQAGEIAEHTYDVAGQLLAITYDDDTVERFSYDALGEIARAKGPGGEVRFERDAAGRVLREVQLLGGEEHAIESAYDRDGNRVRRSSSRGHVEQIERDATGARTRTILDELHDVGHARDAFGREMLRALPRGGRILQTHDTAGRALRRTATASGSLRPVRFDDPSWAGAGVPAQPDRVTVEKEYRYDAERELSDVLDRRRGWLQYDYDAGGRLVSALREASESEERFTYDAAGNHEAYGEPRTYDRGSRLLQRGDVSYRWDTAGRLVEKRAPRADGEADLWRYTWDAAGRLATVDLADGRRAAYAYDPFGRRVDARLHDAPPAGNARLIERTRFVWDGDVLAHAIRTYAEAGGDPVVEERTYCFEDGGFVPWAHADDAPDGHGGRWRTWAFYVNDPIGTPEALIGADGSVLAELDRWTWGQTEATEGARAATALRFQGQYEDRETRLFYNRFRYYDPEAGLYLSADPLGLEGGLRPYGYGPNAIRWIDPFGLTTGIVYLRTHPRTGREYVGKASDQANFMQRRRIHNRKLDKTCPGAKYDFDRLQAGVNPGSDLAQAEEDWIRAGGGPGVLENKIHAVDPKNYKGKVQFP